MIRPLALTALAGLAACSPGGGREKDKAAPALAGEVFPVPPQYAVIFNDLGPNTTLSFGTPDSDDIQLMLSCYKGTGRILASDFWQDGAQVTLRSGNVQADFEGRVRPPTEGMEGAWTDFWVRTESPPIAAFRASGELAARSGRKLLRVKARPAEMAAVESFFAACVSDRPPSAPR